MNWFFLLQVLVKISNVEIPTFWGTTNEKTNDISSRECSGDDCNTFDVEYDDLAWLLFLVIPFIPMHHEGQNQLIDSFTQF